MQVSSDYSKKDISLANKTRISVFMIFRKWSLQVVLFAVCFFLTSLPVFAVTISPETGLPVWKLCIILIELIILGILISFIISDLRVIRWFESKKKSRLWAYKSSLHYTAQQGNGDEDRKSDLTCDDNGDTKE